MGVIVIVRLSVIVSLSVIVIAGHPGVGGQPGDVPQLEAGHLPQCTL